MTDATAVNPREVKRYINAYTLSTQIRPDLDRHRLLALQTMSFRQDWVAARRGLYLYRDVFIDALRRQVRQGESSALEDLDPDLLAIPESFLTYVAAAPGDALLQPTPIDSYLYAGEAARSTQGPAVLDAIQAAAAVRPTLRALRTSVPDRATRAHDAREAVARVESQISPVLKRSVTANLIRADLAAATETLQRFGDPKENRGAEQWAELLRDVEVGLGRVLRRLVDLYLSGDIGAGA